MLDDKLIKKHFKQRKYLHFDNSYAFKSVKKYVTNYKKIELHGFLPLIYYVDKTEKYTKNINAIQDNRPVKEKNRDIKYAGHLDNYIYKYYSLKLNEIYDNWSKHYNIDKCSIAYRMNKKNLSNIDFSAEVINNIVSYKEAFILIGDFTKFFDEIDHTLLKKQLIKVMSKKELPKDWYNVYRSLTKYGYYKKDDINELLGSDKKIKMNGRYSYFQHLKEFREFQKNIKTNYNKKKFGIPQGTALSGVFANIYAIDFDLKMQKIAKNLNGLYRRYSDDFILVIPKEISNNEFDVLIERVYKLAEENKIKLQDDKTQKYRYTNKKIFNLNKDEKPYLDYLGFIFDGKSVKMREKSIYKFYRNAYKIIEQAENIKNEKNLKKLPYRKRIYKLYSDLGSDRKPYGNFISYAKRSQRIFDEKSPNTENKMLNQIKNRKNKIEKKMGLKLHIKI